MVCGYGIVLHHPGQPCSCYGSKATMHTIFWISGVEDSHVVVMEAKPLCIQYFGFQEWSLESLLSASQLREEIALPDFHIPRSLVCRWFTMFSDSRVTYHFEML